MSDKKLLAGEGSGTSTTEGYMIEARSTISPHVKLGTYIFTKEWSFVETIEGWPGVPNHLWSNTARQRGILTYAAAQALMAWAAASCENSMAIGLEFRLVRFKCEETYKVTRLGVTAPRDYFNEQREMKLELEGQKDEG
jgi:hypothetical protein